jgi:hypothetical protein
LLVHHYGQELFELPLALRRDQSAFKQNGAQLIDQRGPLADQPVSGMSSWSWLNRIVGSIAAFAIPTTSRSSFSAPSRRAAHILATLGGRHHRGRRRACRMMSAAAGFHADDARRMFLR